MSCWTLCLGRWERKGRRFDSKEKVGWVGGWVGWVDEWVGDAVGMQVVVLKEGGWVGGWVGG